MGGYVAPQATTCSFHDQTTQNPIPVSCGLSTALAAGDNVGGPIQGTADNQRIGDKIYITGMEIKGEVTPIGAATISDTLRIIIIQDKQSNLLLPTIFSDETGAGYLDTATTGGALFNKSLASKNFVNGPRYRKIMDVTFSANLLQPTASNNTYVIDRFIKFKKPLKQTFRKATTGASTDVSTGSCWMFLIGGSTYNATKASDPNWQFAGAVRTWYKDSC